MHTDLNELLGTARDIAREASDLVRATGVHGVEHKGAVDLVTTMDLRCEELIRKRLGQRTPGIPILAEEGGGDSEANTRWIVDPIDGTTNFVHGYPAYAVSIGLQLDGELAVGCVHDIPNDRSYAAARGAGAWCDDRPLRVSATPKLDQALLVTGFAYDRRERVDFYLAYVRAFLQRAQGLRRGGAAALDFCLLADGRLDGYWEFNLNAWDVAAGVLIVQEAGGIVTNMDGSPIDLFGRNLLATNGPIHDEMKTVLADVGKLRQSQGE